MRKIIGISGKIGSGKTTLGKLLSEKFGYSLVGFGDYIRHEAVQKGMSLDRVTLQDLGQSLLEKDSLELCKNVLKYANFEDNSNLIIDGIRHVEVLGILKSLLQPDQLYLIFVKVDDLERERRLSVSNLEKIDKHSTEDDVRYLLPKLANLTVDGTQPINITLDIISEFISKL